MILLLERPTLDHWLLHVYTCIRSMYVWFVFMQNCSRMKNVFMFCEKRKDKDVLCYFCKCFLYFLHSVAFSCFEINIGRTAILSNIIFSQDKMHTVES